MRKRVTLYCISEWSGDGEADRPASRSRPRRVRPCRPGVCSCMPTRDLSCRSLSPFPSFLLLSRRPQTSPNRVERLFKLSSHYPLDRRPPDLPPSQVSPRELLPYSYCIAVHELGIGPPTNPPARKPIKASWIRSRFRSPIHTLLDSLILHIAVPLGSRVRSEGNKKSASPLASSRPRSAAPRSLGLLSGSSNYRGETSERQIVEGGKAAEGREREREADDFFVVGSGGGGGDGAARQRRWVGERRRRRRKRAAQTGKLSGWSPRSRQTEPPSAQRPRRA